MTDQLVVVGGGNMGAAIIGGLLSAQWIAGENLVVVEKSSSRRTFLSEQFPAVRVVERIEDASPRDVLVAVKPQDAEGVCLALGEAGARRILSVIAGIRIRHLEEWLGKEVVVVRAMPNTPALVRSGVTAISPGRFATDTDLSWAEDMLVAVGKVVRVREELLDAVTGLSGSGPAYVFLVVEALIEAGVLVGLPREVSTVLVEETLLGSARLLIESASTPEELRHSVTSPAGTTAAGLRTLEAHSVRSALIEAVVTATERSRQLGSS
ncbi:MAG: pyrroline-5-carboxylate reductase [Actinobacteria bacterium]|jgi:pyrroline-5-carboxylate reductase|nr:pyrroline-5-carboxylate reductase [Actinomycetota bacterium]MCL6094562.1 pyrroline-5-carboxylate reductase [Actinomycetota bacterium]